MLAFRFLFSLSMLFFAANRFVFGASRIAKFMKFSSLFVGITIIAIGNSMPELCITIISGLKNVPDLAVGTLVGSNIAHVGLVLGLAAIIKPFKINQGLSKTDIFWFFTTSAIASLLLINNQLTKYKGGLLVFTFVAAFGWIIKKEIKRFHSKHNNENIYVQYPTIKVNRNFGNTLIAILWLIFGIIGLHISSFFVVDSAQNIARLLNITNLAAGTLLLGIGTNLPELAIMLASIYNNERDLALGGVLGANIFGITFALGLSGLIFPVTLPAIFRIRDLTSMMIMTTILSIFLLKKTKLVSRTQGIILISVYIAYIISTFKFSA